MRTWVKSWQNTTEYKRLHKGRHGWTRRVKWYEGAPGETIRLCFEDEEGKINAYFDTEHQAQIAYEAFRNGASSLSFQNI